jgi:hypothetical protein
MTQLTNTMLRNSDTIRLRFHHHSYRVGCYDGVVEKKSTKSLENSQKSSNQSIRKDDSDNIEKSDGNVKITGEKKCSSLLPF